MSVRQDLQLRNHFIVVAYRIILRDVYKIVYGIAYLARKASSGHLCRGSVVGDTKQSLIWSSGHSNAANLHYISLSERPPSAAYQMAAWVLAGDVVGALLNRTNKTISFVKNGIDLGVAFRNVDEEKLYPSVGLRTPDEEVSCQQITLARCSNAHHVMSRWLHTIIVPIWHSDGLVIGQQHRLHRCCYSVISSIQLSRPAVQSTCTA